MFLWRIERRKNGKTHLYWSVVENKRLDGGGVVQRHVLYLGEINSSQAEVWRKAIEVFDADAGSSRTLALFPEDRCEVGVDDASVVRLRISEMRLHRPRQWAPVGWRACCGESCNSTGSGRSACPRAGSERAGIRFCKCWSPTD